jgi:hypothetical protein
MGVPPGGGRRALTDPGTSQQGVEKCWYGYSWSDSLIADVERCLQVVVLVSHVKIRGGKSGEDLTCIIIHDYLEGVWASSLQG